MTCNCTHPACANGCIKGLDPRNYTTPCGDGFLYFSEGFEGAPASNPADFDVPTGWQCPLCEVVHSPSTQSCACAKNMAFTPEEMTSGYVAVDWSQFKFGCFCDGSCNGNPSNCKNK